MNDCLPVVSIITVVYNAKDPLAKTMQSVREQKARYPHIEYIVVDGGFPRRHTGTDTSESGYCIALDFRT